MTNINKNLKRKSSDNQSNIIHKNVKNLHTFKKKKLKQMQVDPKKEEIITKLEKILSHKNLWQKQEMENLYFIMYDHFEIASIYGFQIEKGIIDFIDVVENLKNINLAALCMSTFVTIKKPNGTIFLQSLLRSLLTLGIQYFDYFNIPSNLNDINCSLPECSINFNKLDKPDGNIKLSTLVNRILFIVSTIAHIFDGNYEMFINVPFNDIFKIFIAFLSTTPFEILENFDNHLKNYSDVPFYLSLNIWKLFKTVFNIHAVEGCIGDYVPSVCEIIKMCLTHVRYPPNMLLHKIYVLSILEFLSDFVKNVGRYNLSSICGLIETIIDNIGNITSVALNGFHESVVVQYLRVFNQLCPFIHDKNLIKCIKTNQIKLFHISGFLKYLENKEIYHNKDFLTENDMFQKFIKIVNFDFVPKKSEFNYMLLPNKDDVLNEVDKNTLMDVEELEEMDEEVIKEDIVENIDVITNEIQCDNEIKINYVEENIEYITNENQCDNEIKTEEISIFNELEIVDEEIVQSASEDISNHESKDIGLEEMLSSFVPF